MGKQNGKKRQSPSVERQLALALVAILDDLKSMNTDLASEYPARELLKANGYGDLESIPTRVAAITEQINAAVSSGDGKALALLGPALERAKKGLPPLATEKKPRTKKPTTTEAGEKKKRGGKKGETPSLLPEGVPVQCLSCPWEGVGTPDSKCPECGHVVGEDVTDESGAK